MAMGVALAVCVGVLWAWGGFGLMGLVLGFGLFHCGLLFCLFMIPFLSLISLIILFIALTLQCNLTLNVYEKIFTFFVRFVRCGFCFSLC